MAYKPIDVLLPHTQVSEKHTDLYGDPEDVLESR